MKLSMIIAATGVLFLGLAAGVYALPGLSMDAALSVPVPSGYYADNTKAGVGGAVNAFAGLPLLPLKLGGRVAYNRFGHKFGDGSTSYLEIVPSVRYGFGLPLGLLSFFGQFGVGVYRWKSETKILGYHKKTSDTNYGFSAGIGANVLNLMVMPMYQVLFDDDKTSYFTFNVGLSF